MKRIFGAIKNFFLPPASVPTSRRVIPLLTTALIVFLILVGVSIGWEKTNSVSFCGLTCHTMPPEYITHQASVHANVTCEDCHMGRDVLSVLIPRKIRYSWQTGTAMLTGSYEYPIVAKNMRPALDACENCHKPETFTSDKLVEIKHFSDDAANTPASTYLVVKTGGGIQREGLGFGIHWHIENPVYFYATDRERQQIPYVAVMNPDGSKTEYVDVESGIDPAAIQFAQLQKMDCITCHNRVAHGIDGPADAVDSMLTRGLISAEIPDIKKLAVEKLSGNYASEQIALDSIAELVGYYQATDFYNSKPELVNQAVQSLQDFYKQSNFPDQKVTWRTHPDNAGHILSPGCFRCHDGKHLNAAGESVRLECNLCHSIPVVAEPNQVSANLQLNRGFEPETHKNANWINLHRTVFDDTCQGCHTIEDAGGTSNQSFCSNSACHGATYKFAGFDAPGLSAILAEQASAMATPTPRVPVTTPTRALPNAKTATPAAPAGPITWAEAAPIFKASCGGCHSANAMGGVNLTTYQTTLAGGTKGPVIIPGDPDASRLIEIQTAATKHFGQLSVSDLETIRQWILGGALEK